MLKTPFKSRKLKTLSQSFLLLVFFFSMQNTFASEVLCEREGLVIQSITFDGLVKTRQRVVDRQITLQVGDTLQCGQLERARQAVADLGLFKQVSVDSYVDADGLSVNFSVVEKRYLIALPYAASSESGSLNYGVRAKWSNIGGLNQRASLALRKKTFSTDLKDSEEKASLSFTSPQIQDTDFDASAEFAYIDLSTRALGAAPDSQPFNEVFRYSSLGISRWFHQEQRQHGWNLGSTLSWRAWESDNPDLIGLSDTDQSHLGLELAAHYNKVHDNTYSYDGYTFTFRLEPSLELRGDRSPLTQELFGVWHKPVGTQDHSQFEVRGGFGWSDGVYADFVPFQNSVNAQLRGISYDEFEGDRYYYLKTAYLTPYTFKPFDRTPLSKYPSLRAEFFIEADDIYFQDGQRNLQGLAWSVGTGVRWRIPWFVGLQLGAGLAYHSEEKSVGFYITGR